MSSEKGKGWDSLWEEIFSSRAWGKYPAESLIRFMARNFYKAENRSDIKVLEVGCGPGANVWYMSREGFSVSGIDGSETAIAQANSRLANEGLSATLKVGDVMNLPFADGEFDAVVDVQCLSCNRFESTHSILREVKRVLKPQGLFYSRTFTDEMYVGDAKSDSEYLEYPEITDGPLTGVGHVRMLEESRIAELYGEHFSVDSIDRVDETLADRKMKLSEWVLVCKNT